MEERSKTYDKRGVSASKSGLKNILKSITKSKQESFFDGAFCRGINNPFLKHHSNKETEENSASQSFYFQHSDGVGTKASIAYLYHLETKEVSHGVAHFSNLIQDAWVMNTDDLACVGAVDDFAFTTTISRNKNLINDDILKALIQGEEQFISEVAAQGITFHNLGGETADMGDVVRSLAVEATCSTCLKREDFIHNKNITEGLVIVGLASFGKTSYEKVYNSGIGCNGLTSAKHDLLSSKYSEIEESYDAKHFGQVGGLAYVGEHGLCDRLEGTPLSVGEALLSPTRTYLPVMKLIFASLRKKIRGVVHNTGGGQTKCLGFGKNINYVKHNLFSFPPIFKALSTRTPLEEMFQVYNCGHRLEIYTDEKTADEVIALASDFALEAKVIGYTEKSNTTGKNELNITYEQKKYYFES